MPNIVVSGAQVNCSFANPPMSVPFTVAPAHQVTWGASMPVATVQDMVPMTNIPMFAGCISPNNQVFNKTGSPGPCTPSITAPWSPGSQNVTIGGVAALTDASTCQCSTMQGVISIQNAGQTDTTNG